MVRGHSRSLPCRFRNPTRIKYAWQPYYGQASNPWGVVIIINYYLIIITTTNYYYY